MSCAEDPRCAETLEHIDQLLDAEMDLDRYQQLQRHLEECPPCLEQFALMQDLRWKVATSCGCSHAPEALRGRIMSTITQVTLTSGAAVMSVEVQRTQWE